MLANLRTGTDGGGGGPKHKEVLDDGVAIHA